MTANLLLFGTNFAGESDPDLTPHPFTSLTENDNDVALVGGVMRCDMNGTIKACLGHYTFPTSFDPAEGKCVLQLDVKFNPIGMTMGDLAICKLRDDAGGNNVAQGAVTNVLTVPNVNFGFGVKANDPNLNAESPLNEWGEDEWVTLRLELDGIGETAKIFVDGVEKASVSMALSAFTPFDEVQIGPHGGGWTGDTPDSSAFFFYRNVLLWQEIPSPGTSPNAGAPGSIHVPGS